MTTLRTHPEIYSKISTKPFTLELCFSTVITTIPEIPDYLRNLSVLELRYGSKSTIFLNRESVIVLPLRERTVDEFTLAQSDLKQNCGHIFHVNHEFRWRDHHAFLHRYGHSQIHKEKAMVPKANLA